jgi:O-antigen/teichoic acid export membrane protein
VAVPRPGDSRRREAGAAALAAGSVFAGVFAYVYIAVGTRHYGTDEFSGVAQLWTIWFFGSSVLTFPLQHWVIQRLRIDGHGGAVRDVLPRLALVTLGLGTAVAVVGFAVRRDLFDQAGVLYPIVGGLIIVTAAVMGILRGSLAGRSRFQATAAAIGSENIVRVVVGAIVVVAGLSVDLYGAAILSGVLVALAWPRAFVFEGPPAEPVSPFAFLGNVAGGTVIGQSILTGGPVVLSLVGGTRDEVTSLFTALALFRAPYVVALGLSIRATAALTDLMVAGRAGELDRLRHRVALAGVGVMALGGAGAAVLGPSILRLVFGSEVDLTRLECVGLAVASLAALGTLALTLLQMTDVAGGRVLHAWAIGLGVGVVGMVALPFDPLPRVVAAFLASELTAFALMAVLDGSGDRP